MRPHLSLDVRNVEQSVEFYTRLFGIKPQKQTAHYAKFDLHHPPLNFSMQTAGESGPSHVSHLGIEVSYPSEVLEWQVRLEEKGIKTRSEDNVKCCHALQDKIWFSDPDHNEWEVFFVKQHLPVGDKQQSSDTCCGN